MWIKIHHVSHYLSHTVLEAFLLNRRIDKIQLNAKNVFYSEFNIDIEDFPDKIEMDYYNEGIH